MKLCKNCKWIDADQDDLLSSRCSHKAAERAPNPVNGTVRSNYLCSTMRTDNTLCGSGAILFDYEEKDEHKTR